MTPASMFPDMGSRPKCCRGHVRSEGGSDAAFFSLQGGERERERKKSVTEPRSGRLTAYLEVKDMPSVHLQLYDLVPNWPWTGIGPPTGDWGSLRFLE